MTKIKIVNIQFTSEEQPDNDNTFVWLYNSIQAFKKQYSQEDIIKKIPVDILTQIKSVNPHPFFQMYSIAHEGLSKPKILGDEESRPIFWPRKAIQSISNVIKAGIKFFHGHNETNDKITQKELGSVVHSFQEEIDGKLHQIVIGYFPNKEAAINNNICSQESRWSLIENAGQLIAEKCKEITGIALENSNNAQPAFPNARRLGYVQAFENEPGDGKKNPGEGNPGNGEKKMNFEDVVKAVKEMNIFPSQLYSLESLKSDRIFGPEFDKFSNLEKIKVELETNNKKLLDEMGVLKRETEISSAKGRILKIAKEKNVPDKIRAFLEKSFDDDQSTMDDLSDDGLNKYVDNGLKVYQRVAGVIGGTESIEIADNETVKADDYNDPKNNEFLEE